MRVVLYANDMEPITILELQEWQQQCLWKHGMVNLTITPRIKMPPLPPNQEIEPLRCWHVTITAEKLRRNDEVHMMLFTQHEEHALLLKSAFLPGQRGSLREHERDAFAKGFLYALEHL